MPEKSLLSVSQAIANAIDYLEPIVNGTRRLSPKDQDWMNDLKRTLGVESLVNAQEEGKENTHTDLLDFNQMDQAKEQQKLFSPLLDALKIIDASTKYSVTRLKHGTVELSVHNPKIAELLKERYDSKDFQKLRETAEANGAFTVSINRQTGLVTTSDAPENWGMSARQWVTDTVRCGEIEREQDPKSFQKALIMLARFYCQPKEKEAFEASIKDPDYFRKGDATQGVAHIFLPETLDRDDKWFNNKRLESTGLALKALCDLAKAPYDSTIAQQDLSFVIEAIAYLAAYLKAINTDPQTGNFDFDAPSAGPWEELPFAGGLTWDIEAMRAGFESLLDLLYDPAFEGSCAGKRTRLKSFKHSKWLDDKKVIEELMEAARKKIIARLTAGKHPVEHPRRPVDSSLAFISASSVQLADDLDDDVQKHFDVLEFVEKELVRENGIIRYAPFEVKTESSKTMMAPDSYLGTNYWIFENLKRVLAGRKQEKPGERHFGSTDCSSEDELAKRAEFSRPNQEAQWFMVSVISEGYSNQVSRLLKAGEITERRQQLIAHGHKKATEFINRSYARITAAGPQQNQYLKANGRPCPQFKVPEAYEFVSRKDDFAKTVALPGAHTPLAWAASSLYCATRRFEENLQNIEKLCPKAL